MRIRDAIRGNRRLAVLQASPLLALAVGSTFGIATGSWLTAFLGPVVIGTIALALTGLVNPWPAYEAGRLYLAVRGMLPWPLVDFLEDAHRRGVLRQSGAVYQFRHIELQRSLSRTYAEPAARWWMAPLIAMHKAERSAAEKLAAEYAREATQQQARLVRAAQSVRRVLRSRPMMRPGHLRTTQDLDESLSGPSKEETRPELGRPD